MTMAAAATISAANRSRCAAGLCPRLFRRTGFDEKKTLVIHPIVLVRHPLDHSVSDINAQVCPAESFASQVALTRQELLSNIEQS